ncbi:hypothetical protein RIF29_32624 [Crotalaria pallida]|uniref:Uncharacterized protein n=1 Tax=Crotalaria pallida TaxID=3830 RepID=A0AAN9EKM1_CROPI
MDFHSLTRKQLQTLCKKNKIPANITNVAMADALSALPHVEGLDEFLNPIEADGGARTPDVRRAAVRKKVKSTKVSSRVQRGSRAKKDEVDVIVLPDTPTLAAAAAAAAAVPPSRRGKAISVSTRRKKVEDVIVLDDDDNDNNDNGGVQQHQDVSKTPAAVPCSRTKATARTTTLYNTRRSVRLLEKNSSNMSLMDTQDMAPNNLEQEMSNVTNQSQDSVETQEMNAAGSSLQTVSNVEVSEKTSELEVSSLEDNYESEECQSHDLGLGKVNCLEAEPHDSNLKLEGSSEITVNPNEIGEGCDELAVDMNKSIATVEEVDEDNEAGPELLPELEGSCDSSEPENMECLENKDADMDFTKQVDAPLSVEEPDDASCDSSESKDTDSPGTKQGEAASQDAVMEFTEQIDPLPVEEPDDAFCDSSEPEDTDSLGTKQDASSVEAASQDAVMEFTEQDDAPLPVEKSDDASAEVVDQCVTLSVPMSLGSHYLVKLKESVDSNTDIQGREEDDDNQDRNSETADDSYFQSFDEDAADEKDLASPDEVLEHQEKLEVKSEHLEDSRAEIDRMDNVSDVTGASLAVFALEKEPDSENPVTVEVCTESSVDKSIIDAEDVTLESSLQDQTEDLKYNSEDLEAKLQPEDLEDHDFVVYGTSSAKSSENLVQCNTDNQGSEKDDDNQKMNIEAEDGNFFQSFEPMFDDDEKIADEKVLASPEEFLDHREEELEAKSEHSEESKAEIDKMDNASSDDTVSSFADSSVEKDASSEYFTAVTDVCTEPAADKSTVDAENVTLESLLLSVGVPDTKDLWNNSEKFHYNALAECEEHAEEVEECVEHADAEKCEEDVEAEDPKDEREEHAEVEESEKLHFNALAECEEHTEEVEECVELAEAEKCEEKVEAEDPKDECEELAEAEELKDNSEKLDFEAQAEESEAHAAGEEIKLDAALAFPSVPGGICNPQISHHISVESAENEMDSGSSDAFMPVQSYNSNILIDGDVISKEIAIPTQESAVFAEAVAVAPVHDQEISDTLIQSVVADQLKGESLCPAQSESKGFVAEKNMPSVNMMKENLSTAELDKKSVRELKKMLKNLTLDGKSKSKTTNVVKEVEKKRTALQALPENQMTNGEAQN